MSESKSTPERTKCTGKIWNGWSPVQCSNRAQVGKSFCKLHDPQINAEKDAKRRKEWETAYDARNKRREEAERLPNAAPDLLEALKAIVEAWNSPLEKAALNYLHLEKAKAAIAKAEGKE